MRNWKNKKYLLILLLPLGLALFQASALSAKWTEKIYSGLIFKPLGQLISLITGILPFSAAEMIVVLLIIYAFYLIVATILSIIRRKRKIHRAFIELAGKVGIFVAITYFGFVVLWGMNYNRLPFSTITRLEIKPASVKDLAAVCNDLINRANEMRAGLPEDDKGVMDLKDGSKGVFNRAAEGYKIAAARYPELGGNYRKPKGVLLSVVMCYEGITGVYFPFTAEANVNTAVPDLFLPSTTCHEMAHQRGFAREDEANYIAYLTCKLHPDIDFQYSGTMLALIYSMNALYEHDQNQYLDLRKKYSDGVKRDLVDNSNFWRLYEGPVEKISNAVNNAYLKANNQKDGVYSYGRMVDLLIAEYRSK